MEGMFRSEIHKERRSGLRKPERVVLCDDIRIHRGFYPSLERRPATQLLFSTTKDVENVLLIVDIPKPVRRASGVQHPMASLDACPNGERAFKNGLCGLVLVVPGLELVAKEEFDALDVHFPRRVQPGVVDVRQETDGGGEVTGESDGPVEHVLVSLRKAVCRWGAFYLKSGK